MTLQQIKKTIIFIILFLSITTISLHFWPLLKKQALKRLVTLSHSQYKTELSINDLSLSFFPLGLKFNQVQLPNPLTLDSSLKELETEALVFTPDYLSLIRGELKIDSVILRHARVKIHLKTDKPAAGKTKNIYNEYFNQILSLPIQEVKIEKASVEVTTDLKSNQKKITIENFNLATRKSFKSLVVNLSAPQIFYSTNTSSQFFEFGSRATWFLFPEKMRIANTHLYSSSGDLQIKGDLQQLPTSLEKINGRFDVTTSIHLAHLQKLVSLMGQKIELPTLKGFVDAELQLQIKNKQFKSKFDVKAANVKIDQYEVGSTELLGKIDNKELNLKHSFLKNSSGSLKIENANLKLKSPDYPFNFKATTTNINLHQLMISLGAGRVPVYAQLNGSLPCQGLIQPKFNIQCSGQIRAKDLSVSSRSLQEKIVELPQLNAKGNVSISSTEVQYSADLSIDKSQGRSSGKVHYEKGFSIKYSSPQLILSEIKNLVDLDLKGSISINGLTRGTSSWGVVDAQIKGQNLWLKNYFLGDLNSHVTYQNEFLNLNKIEGRQGKTLYKGFFATNVNSSIFKTDLFFPQLEVKDVQYSIKNVLPVPTQLRGQGSARIQAQGPLDIDQLSYNLSSEIKNGSIGIENFDRASIKISAQKGISKTKKVNFYKRGSKVKVTGSLDHRGPLDVKITSTPFLIESSDLVAQFKQNITGKLYSTLKLKGPVTTPNYHFSGKIVELNVEDQELSDSKFNLEINGKSLISQFDFLSGVIKGEMNYPLTTKSPFQLKVSTKNWDYTRFLGLLNSESRNQGYRGELTSQIDISSPSGGFWNSSGQIAIQKFRIEREHLQATHENPIYFIFKKGKIDIENFSLKGKESFLNISGKSVSKNNFNIQFNGKTDLRLLQIFTPFAEEIGGPLSVSFNTKGPFSQPEILGSAFVDNGYIKLHSLIDTFKDVRADLLFSQKKIIVNSLKARLKDGPVWGEGDIQINKYGHVPINLNLHAENTTLEVPQGIESTGNGKLKISGQWFPYLLSGDYTIYKGLVTDRFLQSTEKQKSQLSRNQFLPQALNKNTSSFNLDLKVKTKNPILIKTELLKGNSQGQLHISGNSENPKLKGSLKLDSNSVLLFRDNEFEIINGQMSFKNKMPIDPDIDLEAKSRLKDYIIDLEAQGPISDPLVTLRSDPELPEQDIVSLLAFGVTSETLNRDLSVGNKAIQSTWRLGSAIFTKNPISKEIKKQLGVDIAISSSIDKSNQAVPQATLSKQIGNKANLSVSINEKREFNFNAYYQINNNLFLKGSVDGKDTDSINDENDDSDKNVVGFDLEYKVEFE